MYIYLRKFVDVAPAFEVCPQTRSSMSTASAPANACNTPPNTLRDGAPAQPGDMLSRVRFYFSAHAGGRLDLREAKFVFRLQV